MSASKTSTWPRHNASKSGTECAQELRNSDLDHFVGKDDDIRVTVFDPGVTEFTFKKQTLKSMKSLESYFSSDRNWKFSIISIPQADSYSPLHVTKSGMALLCERLRISSDFLTVLQAMGHPPHDAEYGLGNVIENQYENGSFDITYLSRYYGYREWTDDESSNVIRSWKPRQVGVYHSFDSAKDSHVFVFLHPEYTGSFHASLQELEEDQTKAMALNSRPMILHALLFSSYFNNWRTFLREKGDQFSDDIENLLSQEMKDLDLDVRFDRLQALYDLDHRIAPLEPMLSTLLDQLQALQSIDSFLYTAESCEKSQKDMSCFDFLPAAYFVSRKRLVIGLKTSMEALQKRIQAASRLLESTLELRNQAELGSINRNVYRLQRESVDDSETVRVITILSMMYLPASLVSSIFGMNFFSYSETPGKTINSNGWWLYIAVFIPLTAFTVILLRMATWLSDKRREEKAKQTES